jgi:hypothetical protein
MNTRYLALTTVLTLAAAPLLAADASSRHPSGSGSSGGSSSGSSRGDSSSARSSASASSSSSHHESSSSGARRGDSRSDGRHRGHDGVRVYGGYGWGGYPYYGYYGDYYGGYYGGYYGPSYGGYYGWRGPYVGYGYAHDGNYGSLRVMVEPDDTEVYVDGYYAGEVDSFDGIFQRLHVKSGRHEIALKRAGFRTHRVRVYVPVGGTLHIRYKMERGTGVDPTEGVVGAPEPAESYAPPTRETQREEAQESEEAPSATRAGELHLIVKPADAAVYVDGAFRGNADDVAELGLPPGKHRIEVVRPGYVTFERDIVLGPGQTVEQRAELARSGNAQ